MDWNNIPAKIKASLEAGRANYAIPIQSKAADLVIATKNTAIAGLKKVRMGRYCKCPDGGIKGKVGRQCGECRREIAIRVSDFPKLVRLFSEINNRNPKTVTFYCSEKFFWNCPRCKTEWFAKPQTVHDNELCYACRLIKLQQKTGKVSSDKKLKPEWSEKNKLPATMVLLSSRRKVEWICPICTKPWNESPKNRIAGSECPRCTPILYLKNYANLISEYHASNPLPMRSITTKHKETLSWKCKEPHHKIIRKSFLDRINSNGCPECVRQGKLKAERARGPKRKNPTRQLPA